MNSGATYKNNFLEFSYKSLALNLREEQNYQIPTRSLGLKTHNHFAQQMKEHKFDLEA